LFLGINVSVTSFYGLGVNIRRCRTKKFLSRY
jgi:hypothetical protein